MATSRKKKSTASAQSKAPKSTSTSRTRRPGKAAEATGPVTLEEARALAMARQPSLAKASLKKSTQPPASPYRYGKAKADLQEERRREIERRVREYQATMSIMKQRGARRPTPKGKSVQGTAKAKATAFAPLQILAEGDSWFDYPVPFFGGAIIRRLEKKVGVPILNLAKAGDEVRYMLGVEERQLLTEHLTKGCPAGGPWDVLLFSGGGNDIVDNPMALWIRDFDPLLTPEQQIHQPRFEAALALVRAGYEDLLSLRDRLSPGTHLVLQGYDFAIPDGRGICHLGPWLKPTFDLRGFPSKAAAFATVKAMLRRFAEILTDVTRTPGVTFINGQGTLPEKKSSWHNELHPSQDGFDLFAKVFYRTLNTRVPDRLA
jgi:hypothetical protein